VVTQLGSAEKRMLDLLAGTSPLDAREGDHHRASARLAVPGGRSNERSEANGSIAYRELGQCLHRAGHHGAFPCTLGSSMPALPAVLPRTCLCFARQLRSLARRDSVACSQTPEATR